MRSRLTVVLVAAVAMLGVATGAHAQNKCSAAKIKAAGKKAACKLGVEAGAAAKNLPADTAKLAKCEASFSAAFSKAESKPPCLTTGDTGAIESKVDAFVNDVDTTEVGANTLPSKCISAKLKAAGKKASCKLGILSKAAAKALPPDTAKLAGCSTKFSAASTKADGGTDCGTASGDAGTIEGKVDAFATDANFELNPPTKLSFTTLTGTASCGGPGFSTPAAAPTSGQLFDDTGCSSATAGAALGLGCLYFGGGKATIVAGGKIPDGATSTFAITGPGTLGGSSATGPGDCTKGAGPGMHCVNAFCATDADCNGSLGSCASGHCAAGTQANPLSCASNANCGGSAGSCGLDANCFFGPWLPIASPPPNDALTTCVGNVIETDGSGTFDNSTGASVTNLPLFSRVYITGNSASPCPKCLSGVCDATWSDVNSSPGEDNGKACTAVGSLDTTVETNCRPPLAGFQAPLPTNLNPLTTGTASATNATGQFCPSQTLASAGAFGKATARCIHETGSPAGAIHDTNPHPSKIAAVFCIPKTGNVAVDGVANLPGPGAIGLNGTVQLQ